MKEKRAEKERQTFVDYFYHYFCYYCLCDSDPSYLLFTLYVNLSPWTKALTLRQCFTDKTVETKSAQKDRPLKDPKGKFPREV